MLSEGGHMPLTFSHPTGRMLLGLLVTVSRPVV